VSATDRETDLAVLRFEGPPLPALQLAEPDAALEGVEVVLIGFPIGAALGLFPATHRGLVAAIVNL
jgi:S1-C subfamily serine protease